MACGCQSSTPCSSSTVVLNPCEGCSTTLSTDCVLYKGDRLSYESASITDGSSRTLTQLLEDLESLNCCTKDSKIVQFSTDGTTSYTLVAEDTTKILLLTQYDEGIAGTITNTVILPNSLDFAGKEIIIKNIAQPADSGVTTIVFNFSPAVQNQWVPTTATENDFDTLASAHQTVRLRFVKTTPTSYQWIIVD